MTFNFKTTSMEHWTLGFFFFFDGGTMVRRPQKSSKSQTDLVIPKKKVDQE